MDTDNWYYVTPYKKKAGPVTRDRLFALYLKDKVLPSTLVWTQGMEKWVPFTDKFDGVAPPRVENIVPPPIDNGAGTASNTEVEPMFPFHGRAGRGAIWGWLSSLVAFQLVVIWFVYRGGFLQPGTTAGYYFDPRPSVALGASLVVGVLMLWPGVSVMVRRCHDLGWSGWWTLATFVPYLGVLALVIVGGFVPGAPTANRYGPPPGEGNGKLAERVAQDPPQ